MEKRQLKRGSVAKRSNMIDAAQALFEENGFQNTSIDDIVRRAKVAKGTFYLYFNDKFDIMQQVVLNISCKLLSDAFEHLKRNPAPNLAEGLIVMVDYIVDYFIHNRLAIKLMQRHFSWPMINEQLSEEQGSRLRTIMDEICDLGEANGYSRDYMVKLVYLVVEACGSICLNAIAYQKPDTIENVKPFIYDSIRKLL